MVLFGPPHVEKMRARNDVQGLIKALGYRKDAGVRQSAARALGDIGGPSTLDPLVAALGDTDGGVGPAAAGALSQVGDARAVAPLVAALGDKSSSIRSAAVKALASLQPASIGALVDAISKTAGDRRTAAADGLVLIGAPAVDALAAMAGHGNRDARACATLTLGRIGDARATDALIVRLQDDESRIRNLAVDALGAIGAARSVEPLTAMLHDREALVREHAANALERLGWQPGLDQDAAAYWAAKLDWQRCAEIGGHAVAPLVQAIRRMAGSSRDGALDGLRQVRGGDAVAPLLKALEGSDRYVRLGAAQALGGIGDARAEEALMAALKDEEPSVRLAVVGALGQVAGHGALEALVGALKGEDWAVKRAAAEALDGLGWTPPTVEMEAWHAVATGDWAAAEELGEVALGPLSMVVDQDGPDAALAAEALARMGNSEPLNRLVSEWLLALHAESLSERRRAAEALVVAYRRGELNDRQKARILGERKRISTRHSDRTYHADVLICGSQEGSCMKHDDAGIGVDFGL